MAHFCCCYAKVSAVKIGEVCTSVFLEIGNYMLYIVQCKDTQTVPVGTEMKFTIGAYWCLK